MHIVIVHDRVSNTDAPDAVDVIAQADAVENAMVSLGHTISRESCGLDLSEVRRQLEKCGADMVINLVESIEGKGRLIHLFPFLLDAMGMPYTGARAEAMLLTSNKVLAKQWLSAAGIPTPPWVSVSGKSGFPQGVHNPHGDVWIIKSVWEHASIGLDEKSIIRNEDNGEIRRHLKERSGQLGGACFAETFIDGREFNLSILAGDRGPVVLPPAEIIFQGYSKEMPKIVDYRAKWDENAYAYHHTPRSFDFPSDDTNLLERLENLALRCWECFDLSGYARVDFRVDAAGNPWVLEVNANPCLSPDAGFAAALDRAGIPIEVAMERILKDSMKS